MEHDTAPPWWSLSDAQGTIGEFRSQAAARNSSISTSASMEVSIHSVGIPSWGAAKFCCTQIAYKHTSLH